MVRPYMPPMERNRRSPGGGAPGQLEGGYDENAAPEMPPEEGEQTGEEGEEGKESMAEGKTTHIPIDLLGGKDFKDGDEVVFKIVKIDPENKTAEIMYAPEKGGEEKEGEGEEPAEAAGGESEGMDQVKDGKMMGDGSEY